jgi:hypothetical protein
MNIFEIKEGHDPSSYFAFFGRYDPVTKVSEEFCIEEDHVWEYLVPVINKYIKGRFDYGEERPFIHKEVYSICNDIENICDIIRKDFNDTRFDKIKNGISIFSFTTDEEQAKYDFMNMSKKDTFNFIENNKDRIIDFYNRFIKRVKRLSDNNLPNGKIIICSP